MHKRGREGERRGNTDNSKVGWEIIRPTVCPCFEQWRYQHTSAFAVGHSAVVSGHAGWIYSCLYVFVISIHFKFSG